MKILRLDDQGLLVHQERFANKGRNVMTHIIAAYTQIKALKSVYTVTPLCNNKVAVTNSEKTTMTQLERNMQATENFR
ncbi:hypothetical protein [Alteromonas sp. KUL49]|uniref:hypothetical protein n=1 Tax=Alteromonas sp. KUL49 TaxID=2480798 RepID=UPI00102EFED2|nr:hypothetical protein [Alteromonas sp. KUL49]TAP41289.1 hypothetical protein EYS00_03600 [Alteromonas sp. KUL49]